MTQTDRIRAAKTIRAMVNGAVKGIRAVPAIIQRSRLSDEDALEFAELYPEWKAGRKYAADDVLRHEGELYRVAQDHVAQEQYQPGAEGTDSLYTHITIAPSGWEEWRQPTGAHDAYPEGFIVTDPTDGNAYRCLIDGCVWGPPSQQPQFWELYDAEEAGEGVTE